MYSLPTDDFRQYINGELVSGRGRTTQIRCPGNGEPVAQIALATKEAPATATAAIPIPNFFFDISNSPFSLPSISISCPYNSLPNFYFIFTKKVE